MSRCADCNPTRTSRYTRALAAGALWAGAAAASEAPAGYFKVDFEDDTSVQCRTFQVTASFTGPTHRYSGGGDCTFFTYFASKDPSLPPVDPERARGRHSYTFVGQYDARTGHTTERLTFPVKQTDKYHTATVVELEMRCPVDTWLGPPLEWAWYPQQPWWNQNACELKRVATRGNLLSVRGVSAIMERGFVNSRPQWPYTSRTLFGDEQLRLRDQLAQAEQAERAARIGKATAGSLRDASSSRDGAQSYDPAGALRDASPTRQGTTDFAGSLRDASPSRSGSLQAGGTPQSNAFARPLAAPGASVPAPPPPAAGTSSTRAAALRDASPTSSATSSAAANAATRSPPPVPPPAPSLGLTPPRVDVPNFSNGPIDVPAHIGAKKTSDAAAATVEPRGSTQRSGTPGAAPRGSTHAQGLPGAKEAAPLLPGVGLPDGFPPLPNGQPKAAPTPLKSTTSTATAAVPPPTTGPQPGRDTRTAVAGDNPISHSRSTQVPGASTPTPPPTPGSLGNIGWPSGLPQLPSGAPSQPPPTPATSAKTVQSPTSLSASSVATTRTAPAPADGTSSALRQGLNPQPLPPKDTTTSTLRSSPTERQASSLGR